MECAISSWYQAEDYKNCKLCVSIEWSIDQKCIGMQITSIFDSDLFLCSVSFPQRSNSGICTIFMWLSALEQKKNHLHNETKQNIMLNICFVPRLHSWFQCHLPSSMVISWIFQIYKCRNVHAIHSLWRMYQPNISMGKIRKNLHKRKILNRKQFYEFWWCCITKARRHTSSIGC